MNLPNWLTIIRIILVPFMILMYYVGGPNWNIYAAIIFIVASITDMVDGMLARKMNLVTNFGKLMDPIADKVLVMAALVLMVDWGKVNSVVTIILLAREFVISGFRLVAASNGVVMAAGAIGKWKTVTQLVGMSFIFLGNPIFSLWNIPFGEILLYISMVLSIWSCVEYIYQNRALLKE
ncbi:MAG: CDP-diacylglycerol--glycerol-3-phosphate 3-phosphatidyltransferase [Christensenellaceae bacterium]|jgi:CDP-diacylglycerol--glycerol-3-phosphate 3-phosphatidyltransferase